eukprot:2692598-Amphidinium_carterae.1
MRDGMFVHGTETASPPQFPPNHTPFQIWKHSLLHSHALAQSVCMLRSTACSSLSAVSTKRRASPTLKRTHRNNNCTSKHS